MTDLEIKERVYKYQQIVEDLYIDTSSTLKGVTEGLVKNSRGNVPENSIEQAMCITWLLVRKEADYILGQLATAEFDVLRLNQRNYYMSARYCIEAAADLIYLYNHPQELKRFFTDSTAVAQGLDKIYQDKELNDKQKALAVSALLRKGQLKGAITDRIVKLSPELLREYAVYCMYTHPAYEGHQLYFHSDESFDLMFNEICHTLSLVMQHLILFLQINCPYFEIEKPFWKSLVADFYDCDRRLRNVYYARRYKKLQLKCVDVEKELKGINELIDEVEKRLEKLEK